MYNLLTENFKKVVKREYRYRVLYSTSFFVLVTLFILFFSWAPFYYFLMLRSDFARERFLMLQEQNKAEDNKALENLVKNLKTRVNLLKPATESVSVRNIFLHISDMAPQGVSITGLSWTLDKGGINGLFYVKGVAVNRDGMQDFVRILQNDKTFSGVDFSRSQYAKESNADFTLTLTYTP